MPSELGSVVRTANSMAFNEIRASPLAVFAKNSRASSSITALYTPNPFSTSVNALFIIVLIFSIERAFNSNIILLETRALLTSKYGFSVVAPIKIIVPSSTYGKRASCCDLLNL